MSELVTLPMQMTSKKNTQLIVFSVLSAALLGAMMLYYILNEDKDLLPNLKYILPIGLVVLEIITVVFIIYSLKPRSLVINSTGIDMTPIPVLGIKASVPETRSLSEFQSLDLYVQKGGKSGPVSLLKLRAVLGGKDLALDLPQGVDKHQFAAQLGAALNLKVNDNA